MKKNKNCQKMRWFNRLIDKVSRTDCPNNNQFMYYKHKVVLQSGTIDYTDMTIHTPDGAELIHTSLDFLTKDVTIGYFKDENVLLDMVDAIHKILPNYAIDTTWIDEEITLGEVAIEGDYTDGSEELDNYIKECIEYYQKLKRYIADKDYSTRNYINQFIKKNYERI